IGNRVDAVFEVSDPSRIVEAWILSTGKITNGTRLDGTAHPSKITRAAVDGWLRTVDPLDVLCLVDHEQGSDEVGTWMTFRNLDSGMMGSLVVDRGELGDKLLEILDNDPS